MNRYPVRDRIVRLNKLNGISTIFYRRAIKGEYGFCYGNTIYINLESDISLDSVNLHEKLHFYEKNESFEKVKYEIIKNIDKKRYQKLYMDYLMKYYQIYSPEEIDAGVIDNEIVIDILSGIRKWNFQFPKKVEDYLCDVLEDEMNYLTEKRYSTFEWSDISLDGIEGIDFNSLYLDNAKTINAVKYVIKEDTKFNEK